MEGRLRLGPHSARSKARKLWGAASHMNYENRNYKVSDNNVDAGNIFDVGDRFLRLYINRADTYARQLEDGSYVRVSRPLTRDVLKRHFTGEITVGAYMVSPEDQTTKTLCFDVDPEHVQDPKDAVGRLLKACDGRFPEKSILLEASRHPDPSYHLWGFFEPRIPAKVARWLGHKILEHTGIAVELFPKQDVVNPGDFGNLVKLPLGFHRKEQKWSKFLDPITFKPLPTDCLYEIEGCSFSEEDIKRIFELADRDKSTVQVKLSTAGATHKRLGKVRPCFLEALKNHTLPHRMRLAVAVEYLAAGYNTEHTTALFKDQQDFDEKRTRYQVEHAQKRGYRPRKCATIQRLGFCIGDACPIFRQRKRSFERGVVLLD